MSNASGNLLLARGELIVAAARQCLGTRYVHQGRLAGSGMDCIGLLVHVARELGLPHSDNVAYHRRPGSKALARELPKCGAFDPIDVDSAESGDVLMFWIQKPENVSHCGILTPKGMIHTFQSVGRVVEHAFGEPWSECVASAWRFRWPS